MGRLPPPARPTERTPVQRCLRGKRQGPGQGDEEGGEAAGDGGDDLEERMREGSIVGERSAMGGERERVDRRRARRPGGVRRFRPAVVRLRTSPTAPVRRDRDGAPRRSRRPLASQGRLIQPAGVGRPHPDRGGDLGPGGARLAARLHGQPAVPAHPVLELPPGRQRQQRLALGRCPAQEDGDLDVDHHGQHILRSPPIHRLGRHRPSPGETAIRTKAERGTRSRRPRRCTGSPVRPPL